MERAEGREKRKSSSRATCLGRIIADMRPGTFQRSKLGKLPFPLLEGNLDQLDRFIRFRLLVNYIYGYLAVCGKLSQLSISRSKVYASEEPSMHSRSSPRELDLIQVSITRSPSFQTSAPVNGNRYVCIAILDITLVSFTSWSKFCQRLRSQGRTTVYLQVWLGRTKQVDKSNLL